jgi:hypothetical protein
VWKWGSVCAGRPTRRSAGRREVRIVVGAVIRSLPTCRQMMMMYFTVVCDAPTSCVFDFARRKAPEHYWLAASFGGGGLGAWADCKRHRRVVLKAQAHMAQ